MAITTLDHFLAVLPRYYEAVRQGLILNGDLLDIKDAPKELWMDAATHFDQFFRRSKMVAKVAPSLDIAYAALNSEEEIIKEKVATGARSFYLHDYVDTIDAIVGRDDAGPEVLGDLWNRLKAPELEKAQGASTSLTLTRGSILSSPKMAGDLANQIIKGTFEDGDKSRVYDTLVTLAMNKNLPSSTLNYIEDTAKNRFKVKENNRLENVLNHIAAHPNATPEQLEGIYNFALGSSYKTYIMGGLAKNPNVPDHLKLKAGLQSDYGRPNKDEAKKLWESGQPEDIQELLIGQLPITYAKSNVLFDDKVSAAVKLAGIKEFTSERYWEGKRLSPEEVHEIVTKTPGFGQGDFPLKVLRYGGRLTPDTVGWAVERSPYSSELVDAVRNRAAYAWSRAGLDENKAAAAKQRILSLFNDRLIEAQRSGVDVEKGQQLLAGQSTDYNVLKELSKSPNFDVLYRLAGNRRLPADIADDMANMPLDEEQFNEIGPHLATGDNVSSATIEKISANPFMSFNNHENLIENSKNISSETLKAYLGGRTNEPLVIRAAIQHHNTKKEDLIDFFDRWGRGEGPPGASYVVNDMESDTIKDPDVLDSIVNAKLKQNQVDGYTWLFSNRNLSENSIRKIYSEIGTNIPKFTIRAMARAINVPDDVLGKLKDHTDYEVADIASSRLAETRPDLTHKEWVHVKYGTNKLRILRDKIEGLGADEAKPSQLPKELVQAIGKTGRLPNGNYSARLLQRAIDDAPTTRFNISHDEWDGGQQHSNEPSQVLQVSASNDIIAKLKEAGVYSTYKKLNEFTNTGHPVSRTAGIGWIRYTGDDSGIHIDEIQSDMGQGFSKQMGSAIDAAVANGQLSQEEAERRKQDIAHDFPEDHLKKIDGILFGGKHPSEMLFEAFLEWARTTKIKVPLEGSGPVLSSRTPTIEKEAFIGTPVHIWDTESKAPISGWSLNKPLPKHGLIGYREAPKKAGFVPGEYGELPTQINSNYKAHKGLSTADIDEDGNVSTPEPVFKPGAKTHKEVIRKAEEPGFERELRAIIKSKNRANVNSFLVNVADKWTKDKRASFLMSLLERTKELRAKETGEEPWGVSDTVSSATNILTDNLTPQQVDSVIATENLGLVAKMVARGKPTNAGIKTALKRAAPVKWINENVEIYKEVLEGAKLSDKGVQPEDIDEAIRGLNAAHPNYPFMGYKALVDGEEGVPLTNEQSERYMRELTKAAHKKTKVFNEVASEIGSKYIEAYGPQLSDETISRQIALANQTPVFHSASLALAGVARRPEDIKAVVQGASSDYKVAQRAVRNHNTSLRTKLELAQWARPAASYSVGQVFEEDALKEIEGDHYRANPVGGMPAFPAKVSKEDMDLALELWPSHDFVIQHPNTDQIKLRANIERSVKGNDSRQGLYSYQFVHPDAMYLPNKTGMPEVNYKFNDASSVKRLGGPIEVRHNTQKLRKVRDLIAATGNDEVSPNQLPKPLVQALGKVGRTVSGNYSASKLQQFINQQPAKTFNWSDGLWTGQQRHNTKYSKVFQLNATTDHIQQIKDAGLLPLFKRLHDRFSKSHPVGPAGIGWVRWTGDKNGVMIDEIQSDYASSLVKKVQGMVAREVTKGKMDQAKADEVVSSYAKEFPDDQMSALQKILFGGKHASEVLHDAFHEYLRLPVHEGNKEDPWGGKPKQSLIGAPVHIWTPESKAGQAMGDVEEGASIPAHMLFGYGDLPKKAGYEPAKYGEIPTQDNPDHKERKPGYMSTTFTLDVIEGRNSLNDLDKIPALPAKDTLKEEIRKSEGKVSQLPEKVQKAFNAVRASLSDDLRKPEYRGNANKYHGHCYVASEALHHLLGGSEAGWHPQFISWEGSPHWYLKHLKTGTILDPTAEQFKQEVPYHEGTGKGFLTKDPSKRARTLIDRAKGNL